MILLFLSTIGIGIFDRKTSSHPRKVSQNPLLLNGFSLRAAYRKHTSLVNEKVTCVFISVVVKIINSLKNCHEGHGYYLYRAIDKAGNLVDVYLSESRDKKAVKRFFSQCAKTSGIIPNQITTDKEPVFSNAIKSTFGPAVIHRDSKYLNNRMGANHRGVKSWYYPMKGWLRKTYSH